MAYKILIAIAGLFGLLHLFRTADRFARIILVGQIAAIGLVLFYEPGARLGMQIYMAALVLIMLYGFTQKGLIRKKRNVIISMAFFALLPWVFRIYHYPGAGWLGLLMIIPVVLYVKIAAAHIKSYKNEFAFLTILAVDAIIVLFLQAEWLLHKLNQ